jgi:hypothetical protein
MKHRLLLFITLLMFSSILAVGQTKKPVPKQTPKPKETLNLIREGKGMDGFTIGKSTMDDVVRKFGRDYKWTVNKKYSFQMTYSKLGLSFYICQSDPKKQIFVLEMRAPYKAKTSRGIVLGRSTLEDINKAYGKAQSGTEYRGISFYYNKIGGKNVVTVIDVTENSGIRQCKVGK